LELTSDSIYRPIQHRQWWSNLDTVSYIVVDRSMKPIFMRDSM